MSLYFHEDEVPLCFLELPFYFPEVPFCFLEVPFYFSKMAYCFRELRFSIPKVTSLLNNPKTSTWSITLYAFYLHQSLHDSLENAVFEHLEWLKF